MARKKVAIIGSGLYGLAALRHLKEVADVVCYERKDLIGGMWNYEEDPDKHHYITPVYANLRLNTATAFCEFPDFPMPKETSPFPDYKEYIYYLNLFAEKFDLKQYIKLKTWVAKVSVVEHSNGKFLVQTRNADSESSEMTDNFFDDVVVATGYYTKPIIPDYPGRDIYRGDVIHSWRYRRPEKYAGKRVIIVGDQISAWDLTWDIAEQVQTVFVSHHTLPLFITLPENGKAVPAIEKFTETGVVLTNGEHVVCDAVIYCTGYTPEFPFLDGSCKTVVTNGRIENLYKMMVHTKVPGLFFAGFYFYAALGPIPYIQAEFIASVIAGKIHLPPPDQMEAEVEEAFNEHQAKSGKKPSDFHCLGYNCDVYCKDLESFGAVTPVKPVLHNMCKTILDWCLVDKVYITCRNRRMIPINDVEFKVEYE